MLLSHGHGGCGRRGEKMWPTPTGKAKRDEQTLFSSAPPGCRALVGPHKSSSWSCESLFRDGLGNSLSLHCIVEYFLAAAAAAVLLTADSGRILDFVT